MTTFAVNSTFDVAFWFADQALNENEYLQPMKMHRLLYLSQAFYAIAYGGRKLMPATFVADEQGPIEPTVYQAFTRGRPDVEVELFLPAEVELFLTSIWRRFGHLKTEQLTKLTNGNLAYSIALKKGRRTEIALNAMTKAFKAESEKKNPTVANKFDHTGQRVLRTQDGATVKVKAWLPGAKG
ncbi:MAG: hypothetical protein HQL36_11825 [Alphaproteobacteria bacterium]|nr:hypothetical protein [Alphaproteobacteria bacterium]MBF0250577.1 hypothetical protein [Alphaproteobacteria bacterium]